MADVSNGDAGSNPGAGVPAVAYEPGSPVSGVTSKWIPPFSAAETYIPERDTVYDPKEDTGTRVPMANPAGLPVATPGALEAITANKLG
jgi:hypothetical protein